MMVRQDKQDRATYYHDLRSALEEEGCPICRVLNTAVQRYLDGVLYELVLDPQVRHEINRARGYCNRHAWMLVRTGSALGVAILMQSVIRTLVDDLDACAVEQEPGSLLHRLRGPGRPRAVEYQAVLAPQTPCPACRWAETVEGHLVSSLVSHLSGPEPLTEAYRSSHGLCLAHFRQAMSAEPSQAEAKTLVAAQRAIWKRLHGELEEFIRKNDHRFRDEEFGMERDSWLRALESVSGPSAKGRKRS